MSGSDPDLVLEILRGIRAAAERTNAQLEATNLRLDQLTERVEVGFSHFDRQFAAVGSAIADLGSQFRVLMRHVKTPTEVEVEDLKLRVAKLEAKVG